MIVHLLNGKQLEAAPEEWDQDSLRSFLTVLDNFGIAVDLRLWVLDPEHTKGFFAHVPRPNINYLEFSPEEVKLIDEFRLADSKRTEAEEEEASRREEGGGADDDPSGE
jgi:hypothetical protein